jgi:hypothetical protein
MLVSSREIIIVILTLIFSFNYGQALAEDHMICNSLLGKPIPKRILPSIFGDRTDPDRKPYSELQHQSLYWVTTNEGTAGSLDCKTNNISKAIFYPIGLLLKPLYDLPSPYQDQILFLTEYGLNIILKRSQVTPIGKDSVFFFSDGIEQYSLCINSKERKPVCDPRVENKKSQAALSAKFGYVQGVLDLETTKIIENYESYRQFIFSNPDSTEVPRNICENFNAGTFYSRADLNRKNHGFNMVSISLCTYENQNIKKGLGIKPIKVVTYKSAENKFVGLNSSMFFQRRENLNNILIVIDKNVNNRKSVKQCNEEIVFEDLRTIKFNVGAGIEKIVTVQANYEIAKKIEFQQSFKQGEMLFIKAYTLQKGTAQEGNLSFPIFDINDIWINLRCDKDNSYPEGFKSIVIYHPYATDNWIAVVPNVLKDDYTNVAKSYGVPPWKEQGRNLHNGILWNITDYKQYFFWRKVLRDYFSKDSKVREIMDRYENPSQKDQVVDYFVHLLMSAVFESEVR